jgi:hypothetical protein
MPSFIQWILIFIAAGFIFSIIGQNAAGEFAFDIVKFLIGIWVFLFLMFFIFIGIGLIRH